MTAARRGLLLAAATAIALGGAACRDDGNAILLVVVKVSGSPPPVDSLHVTVNGQAGDDSKTYDRSDGSPITFPTTLIAELPARATGDITIDVRADNAAGMAVASGREAVTGVRPGEKRTVYVQLTCADNTCVVDAGIGPDPDGGVGPTGPNCGNGRIDTGETCDIAIARGDPGACPAADCDDGVACTKDKLIGGDCTATCAHEPITAFRFGDNCCPAGGNPANDPDCSETCGAGTTGAGTIEPGETCDTAIAPGQPGACPRLVEDCTAPPQTCETSMLVSAGTCSAICMRMPVVKQSDRTNDGCCPVGATNATDTDCPIICGNGVVDSGEPCDIGIPALSAGSCPTSCDDGKSCTADFMTGTGCQVACQHDPITALISGDGCCPQGATHRTDTDCALECGNGVVDPGEACDKTATGNGACPTGCPPSPTPCLRSLLRGDRDDCSARCVLEPVTTCSLLVTHVDAKTGKKTGDQCCPPGCTSDDDIDCSSQCGDGARQPDSQGETCDILTPVGTLGTCPTSCVDDDPCTENRLMSAGTCHAKCVFTLITSLRAGDGCCPANVGGNFTLDPDCRVACRDGVVDAPIETCDNYIPTSCPAACPPQRACTRFELQGTTESCTARCVPVAITACSMEPDNCCPAGCTALTDKDCPTICGDGVVEPTETCDRAITAGKPGACAATCDDRDACTVDLASGSAAGCTRSCVHRRITACLNNDGCCPAGCPDDSDSDCRPLCGDGEIGARETCDPPATCPSACPDDGDTCTVERLEGSAQTCNVACVHAPITACSGSTADSCCPTGCTFATDTDC